ncbi:MAG: glycosyltransferase [Dehalococcoidia bacterium]|nr:glycosyltransferase [Dehalococcoidia bacterium]
MNDVTFAMLSFEGPDPYSLAGGLGSRVSELSHALASMGFETHLFFIGDPNLPSHESREADRLHLHRWCQWISHYHPGGVYDGEEGKVSDWGRSLPPWLETELLEPKVAGGSSVVVLAEEWQTTGSVLALREILVRRGWQDRVRLLWNANNTYSFHRIDWGRLKEAATITTVSRYMKHTMWRSGVDALVIPNGVPDRWLQPLEREASRNLSQLFRGRLTLVKVARWDPDKRWLMAVDAVAEAKRLGLRPLFLARGGVDSHQHEVLAGAKRHGLRVASIHWTGQDIRALVDAIGPAVAADMLVLQGYLSEMQRRALFHTADAVLANSGLEPFGLVGLETMAAGGVAFVGCTGEEYATPGYDAISLQTNDPLEIVHYVAYLRGSPDAEDRLRRAARRSAARYTWHSVIRRVLIPILQEMGVRFAHQKRSLDAFPPEIAQESLPMLTTPAAAPVALGRAG